MKPVALFSILVIQFLAFSSCSNENETRFNSPIHDNVNTPKNSTSVTQNQNQLTCLSRVSATQIACLVLERKSNGNVAIVSNTLQNNTDLSITSSTLVVEDDVEMDTSNGILLNTTSTDSYWMIPFDGSNPVDVSAPIGANGIRITCECCSEPNNPSTGTCSIGGSITFGPPTIIVIECKSNECTNSCGMNATNFGSGIPILVNKTAVLIKANAIE